MNSTLRSFKLHGTDCKICGIKGLFFKERINYNLENRSILRLCTKELNPKKNWTGVNFIGGDHIIPLSRGGANELVNVQPLCHTCNTLKGNKINIEYKLVYDTLPFQYDYEVSTEYFGSNTLLSEEEVKKLITEHNISYEEILKYAKKIPINHPIRYRNKQWQECM